MPMWKPELTAVTTDIKARGLGQFANPMVMPGHFRFQGDKRITCDSRNDSHGIWNLKHGCLKHGCLYFSMAHNTLFNTYAIFKIIKMKIYSIISFFLWSKQRLNKTGPSCHLQPAPGSEGRSMPARSSPQWAGRSHSGGHSAAVRKLSRYHGLGYHPDDRLDVYTE